MQDPDPAGFMLLAGATMLLAQRRGVAEAEAEAGARGDDKIAGDAVYILHRQQVST